MKLSLLFSISCLQVLSFILLIAAFIVYNNMSATTAEEANLFSVDFEVFGHVQGVFFRKYTQKQAKKLGLTGYCMNTEKGTVQGTMVGAPKQINEMKKWLQEVGSPSSRIDKAVFGTPVDVKGKSSFSDFVIRR